MKWLHAAINLRTSAYPNVMSDDSYEGAFAEQRRRAQNSDRRSRRMAMVNATSLQKAATGGASALRR